MNVWVTAQTTASELPANPLILIDEFLEVIDSEIEMTFVSFPYIDNMSCFCNYPINLRGAKLPECCDYLDGDGTKRLWSQFI